MSRESAYVHLPQDDDGSPVPAGRNTYFLPRSTPQLYGDDDNSEVDERIPVHKPWWKRLVPWGTTTTAPQALPQESGYLTLIPLSDSRLKPQRTSLLLGCALLVTITSLCAVYFLVSRGVSVGAIQVESEHISINATARQYVVLLRAIIPIHNPNYLDLTVTGQIKIRFYDQKAASQDIPVTVVPARTEPYSLELRMDASGFLSQKYLSVMASQCLSFPQKLIFFLSGQLEARYLTKQYSIDLDNYFIIPCLLHNAVGGSGARQLMAAAGE